MITFNIENLLKKNEKTKYWLCQQMGITNRNLNRIIEGKTTSISLEDLCKFLNCSISELINLDLTK